LDVKNIEFENSAIIYLIRYYLDNMKKDSLIDFKLDYDDDGDYIYHYCIHLTEKGQKKLQ
jgi:hypothetical protein